jgi:hypothetical protein
MRAGVSGHISKVGPTAEPLKRPGEACRKESSLSIAVVRRKRERDLLCYCSATLLFCCSAVLLLCCATVSAVLLALLSPRVCAFVRMRLCVCACAYVCRDGRGRDSLKSEISLSPVPSVPCTPCAGLLHSYLTLPPSAFCLAVDGGIGQDPRCTRIFCSSTRRNRSTAQEAASHQRPMR